MPPLRVAGAAEIMATEGANADAKAGAEVYHGSEICKQKVLELFGEMGLPRGLLPPEGIEEYGYVKESGFVWLKRPKKYEYLFKATGNLCSYGPEISGYFEKGKMKRISGVKVRVMRIWLTLSEMRIDNPASGMIYFQTSIGKGKYSPIKMYEDEYDKYMS